MKLTMDPQEFDLQGCIREFKRENEEFKFMKCDLVSFLSKKTFTFLYVVLLSLFLFNSECCNVAAFPCCEEPPLDSVLSKLAAQAVPHF